MQSSKPPRLRVVAFSRSASSHAPFTWRDVRTAYIVMEILEGLIDKLKLDYRVDELELDQRALLGIKGREFGYTTRGHTLQANLICCYERWRCRIFAGTVLDGPGSITPDRLAGLSSAVLRSGMADGNPDSALRKARTSS